MTDIEVVRAVYAAMAERDFDRLFELVDPACVITQDRALPWVTATSATTASRRSRSPDRRHRLGRDDRGALRSRR